MSGTTSEGNTLAAIQMTLRYAEAAHSSNNDLTDEDINAQWQEPEPIPIVVERQGELLNEFTNNDELLCGAFPWLFLFGKGLCGSGPVPRTHTTYLLQHFNQRFARDHNFIFLMFNQLRRQAFAPQGYILQVEECKVLSTLSIPIILIRSLPMR